MSNSLTDTLAQLKSLGNEKVRAHHRKSGAGDNQFGVMMGDIRKVAAKIKTNHGLALALWDTGIIDAQLLAILVMTPKNLSAAELDAMVRTVGIGQVADWLASYVTKNHPDKETLRQKWMNDKNPWAARAGWSLTAGRVARESEGLDIPALLDRIEAEIATADPAEQWTMNNTLAGIGIHHAAHRKRAVAIGEKLGVYRDYPVPKGCTSPSRQFGSTKWCDARSNSGCGTRALIGCTSWALETMILFRRSREMQKPAKNTICIWYNRDAEEAARFYAKTFPNSSVEAVHLAPGDFPSGKKGDVLTVEFTVLGIPCLGLNGGPEFKQSEAFSFQIATDDQAETDRYWNAIVDNDGQESACGWCKDKWGLSWQITPVALTKAVTDPDPAAAKRAFDAMMDMKKIDIATIEAAQRG